MPQTQEQLVGSVALERALQELEDVVVTFEETTDPDSPEYADEYQRLLSVLYQALEDAQVATDAASDAATLATQRAAYAKEQGDYAKAKADEIEDAKGSFNTLDARLDWIEENAGSVDYEENSDPMGLLDNSSSSG